MRDKTKKKRRGIVLITTLSIMTFLVMLSTMLITSGYSSMRRASSFLESELAYHAALTGMVYAQAKLEEDMAWMSKEPDNDRQVSMSGISIEESGQTIIGNVSNANGNVSQFRISFDSALSPTAFSPPINYLSLNNLQYDATGVTYQLNGDKTDYETYRKVPGKTVEVIVEGIVLDSAGNVRARRVIEASFQRDLRSIVDSVAFSGNDINIQTQSGGSFNVGQAQGTSNTSSSAPGVRVLGSVSYSSEDYDSYNAGASSINLNQDDGKTAIWHNNSLGSSQTKELPNLQNTSNASNSTSFPKITFEEAYSGKSGGGSFNASQSIAAGAYVYWKNAGQTSYTTRYYADLYMDPNDSTKSYSFNADNFSVVETRSGGGTHTYVGDQPPSGSPLDSTTMTVALSANTSVTPSHNGSGDVLNTNLTIVAADRDTEGNVVNARPSIKLTSSSRTGSPPVLLNQGGSIYIGGDISGQGSLVAGGDLTFQGHSVLKPTNDLGISLYAKGDVTVKPITVTEESTVNSISDGLDNEGRPEEEGTLTLSGTALTNAILTSAERQSGGYGDVQITDVTTAVNDIKNGLYYDSTGRTVNGTNGKPMTVKAVLAALGYPENQIPQVIETVINKNLSIESDGQGGTTMILRTSTGGSSGGSSTTLEYQDQTFYGMVYTWEDFKADVGNHSFTINGALVAYGGDPSTDAPGTLSGKGNIDIKGKTVSFTYDPAYLGALSRLFPTGVAVKKSYFAVY